MHPMPLSSSSSSSSSPPSALDFALFRLFPLLLLLLGYLPSSSQGAGWTSVTTKFAARWLHLSQSCMQKTTSPSPSYNPHVQTAASIKLQSASRYRTHLYPDCVPPQRSHRFVLYEPAACFFPRPGSPRQCNTAYLLPVLDHCHSSLLLSS
jgi:hypothetical protein